MTTKLRDGRLTDATRSMSSDVVRERRRPASSSDPHVHPQKRFPNDQSASRNKDEDAHAIGLTFRMSSTNSDIEIGRKWGAGSAPRMDVKSAPAGKSLASLIVLSVTQR